MRFASLLCLICFSAFAKEQFPTIKPTQKDVLDIETVLNIIIFDHIDLLDKKYVKQGYITKRFYNNYYKFMKGDCTDKEMEEYVCGPCYNPIICGQDFSPGNPSFEFLSFQEDKAVISGWGWIEYTLYKEHDKWKLDNTNCFESTPPRPNLSKI